MQSELVSALAVSFAAWTASWKPGIKRRVGAPMQPGPTNTHVRRNTPLPRNWRRGLQNFSESRRVVDGTMTKSSLQIAVTTIGCVRERDRQREREREREREIVAEFPNVATVEGLMTWAPWAQRLPSRPNDPIIGCNAVRSQHDSERPEYGSIGSRHLRTRSEGVSKNRRLTASPKSYALGSQVKHRDGGTS